MKLKLQLSLWLLVVRFIKLFCHRERGCSGDISGVQNAAESLEDTILREFSDNFPPEG